MTYVSFTFAAKDVTDELFLSIIVNVLLSTINIVLLPVNNGFRDVCLHRKQHQTQTSRMEKHQETFS